MATYAIGDVQGCFKSLTQLTRTIRLNQKQDRLWFVGDLVNRGPDSLNVLRYIRELGSAAIAVLGNHDLFLLAVAAGLTPLRPGDTLIPILEAPDAPGLMTWLRQQPLLYREGDVLLVHAGLLPGVRCRARHQRVTSMSQNHSRRALSRGRAIRCGWPDPMCRRTL